MSTAGVRVGVGTWFVYDGQTVEVVQVAGTAAGMEVVAADSRGHLLRLGLKELLLSERARVIPSEPGLSAADEDAFAGVWLSQLTAARREQMLERAGHVREVLTGYRSGSAELARPGEPRPRFDPGLPLEARYAAKAAELGAGVRTVKRWVSRFRQLGEAGLARDSGAGGGPLGRADERWVQMALEVMAEHAGESKPSRKMVIERTAARLAAADGHEAVPLPSRATAYRLLEELERRQPTFRLSAKRNQDIAARPGTAYGKLRPTRPGEYLLMDTTRLDVFAVDPVTLRWLQAELTVAMDWYTRCITGLRLTPVSTKAVDAAATLYQAFRPRRAAPGWPAHAVWPEHGIPRIVLVDRQAIDGPAAGVASPPLVPETLVVDHGKIYVGEHLTSVCRRLGISIQPARLRTGRDKGPVERFFRTLREDLLQALPGYKGPDVHSRGADPEGGAFFFLDELEAIIREWVAIYHHRPHDGLADPGVPGLVLSPAAMFEHGIARAGYIEVPRDPDLAFEFLKVERRTIQHYGVEIGSRRYNGTALNAYRNQRSSHPGGAWPFHLDPDDITRIYFRDPADRRWHTLLWEHAPAAQMPLSEDALAFARRLAASQYRYPDDRLAVAGLLERWNLGLGTTLAERRMALRMSRQQATFDLPETGEQVTALPSVRQVLESGKSPPDPAGLEQALEGGDDDEGDLDAADDFYADALEDV